MRTVFNRVVRKRDTEALHNRDALVDERPTQTRHDVRRRHITRIEQQHTRCVRRGDRGRE